MKIKKNGKVVRLTESDLKKIVEKVLVTEEAMADTNLRDIKAWTKPGLRGGMSYAPNERADGYFSVRGPLIGNSMDNFTKPRELQVYDVKYTGLDCKFTPKKGAIKGIVQRDKKHILWKVPFTMSVTPAVVKALEEGKAKDSNRIELGNVSLSANITNFDGNPMPLSAFPMTTNIDPGAAPKRN
tara:strand:- start:704 stop:1255 length:552 start_codon:yes stop_codon:yes gene_type:complete